MDTDIQSGDVETVTMSDILQLSRTWDQPRSTEQLIGFIDRREAAISDVESDSE